MRKVFLHIALVSLLAVQVDAQDRNAQLGGTNAFFSNPDIEVQNIYPNPASNMAILNYSLLDPQKEAKIVVHDLLGTMTRDYPLNHYEKTLKIDTSDFKEGVYFYTLYSDGENKVTKKLIIKK